MEEFSRLVEVLESRVADGDRVAALARWLRRAGRQEGAVARDWLVQGAPARAARPARVATAALIEAARSLCVEGGEAGWLFDAALAAGSDRLEAVAQLLPLADDAAGWSAATLSEWLARWRDAAAVPENAARARTIVASVARLDDPFARRWALRAVAGLVRPLVDAWQWQRAWASAFDEDVHALAWQWHGADAQPVPRPRAFVAWRPAPEESHADLLAAWRRCEAEIQAAWPGWSVQVVRHGDSLAVWRRDGPLLNAALPPALLDPRPWPDGEAIEATLIGWHGGRPEDPGRALAPPSARRRGQPAPRPSVHLVITAGTWGGGDGDAAADLFGTRDAPPPVFRSTLMPPPELATASLSDHARAARAAGYNGLWIRRGEHGLLVEPPSHRVRAVLQYVPARVLVAGDAAVQALAEAECGFAVWNRFPLTAEEQHEAMAASMRGEFIAAPAHRPDLDGLRLLPLARTPLLLSEDEAPRLHAWLRARAGQRFGDMVAVAPEAVFELGYTAVRASRRHRLGAVLEGARVNRWCADAAPGTADIAASLVGADN